MPLALQAVASSVTLPEKAITVLPWRFAIFATPLGALPITVCSSSRPSPVITMSASFT